MKNISRMIAGTTAVWCLSLLLGAKLNGQKVSDDYQALVAVEKYFIVKEDCESETYSEPILKPYDAQHILDVQNEDVLQIFFLEWFDNDTVIVKSSERLIFKETLVSNLGAGMATIKAIHYEQLEALNLNMAVNDGQIIHLDLDRRLNYILVSYNVHRNVLKVTMTNQIPRFR